MSISDVSEGGVHRIMEGNGGAGAVRTGKSRVGLRVVDA